MIFKAESIEDSLTPNQYNSARPTLPIKWNNPKKIS
jgi:hypothetical protein